MNNPRIWDIGDPEPNDCSLVESLTLEDLYSEPLILGRCSWGEWKTYLLDGKSYWSWEDVVRRFGPVREVFTYE